MLSGASAAPETPRQGRLPLHPDPAMGQNADNRLIPPVCEMPPGEFPGMGKRGYARGRKFAFSRGRIRVFRKRLPASKDGGSREDTPWFGGLGAEEAPKEFLFRIRRGKANHSRPVQQ